MIDTRAEFESRKETATEVYLRSLNPELWSRISAMTMEEQDERWFALTQIHLTDYQAGKLRDKDFKNDELELLFLNELGTKFIAHLNHDIPIRGFISLFRSRHEKLSTFGAFIEITKALVMENLQKKKQSRILVSGIGISGKATTRNVLTKELTSAIPDSRVLSWDRDYEKLFPPPWEGEVTIVEDVHGLDEGLQRFDGEDGLPGGYDLIIYTLSPKLTYKHNLISRGISWVRSGKIDLTAPEKQSAVDLEERVKETAHELDRTTKAGKEWFREHIRVLSELRKRGVPIVAIDPTRIFKEFYGFKDIPELQDKSFLELLEKEFGIDH